MPSPISSMGMVTISAPAPGLMPPMSTSVPAIMDNRPRRTIRRGRALGASRGMPTAAASRATESGSRRMPVCSADSSSTTDRNSGMVKNTPAWMEELEEEHGQAAGELGVAQHGRADERFASPALDVCFP